jgi:hypothetical protein
MLVTNSNILTWLHNSFFSSKRKYQNPILMKSYNRQNVVVLEDTVICIMRVPNLHVILSSGSLCVLNTQNDYITFLWM